MARDHPVAGDCRRPDARSVYARPDLEDGVPLRRGLWLFLGFARLLDPADLVSSGAGAAAGIAAVNSIGNLGGYFGPQVFGWLKDFTGNEFAGMAFLAACALIGAGIVFVLGHDPALEKPAPAL